MNLEKFYKLHCNIKINIYSNKFVFCSNIISVSYLNYDWFSFNLCKWTFLEIQCAKSFDILLLKACF